MGAEQPERNLQAGLGAKNGVSGAKTMGNSTPPDAIICTRASRKSGLLHNVIRIFRGDNHQ